MAWEGSTRRRRLPPGWAKTVIRILKRDGRVCHVCGGPGADEVDHVRPGDDHSDANLAAIHGDPCHRIKSAREGARARRRPVPLRRPAEPHPGLR